MRSSLQIGDVRFTSSASDRSGLLGWVSLTLNDSVRLDGLALRRTLRARLTLSFPVRKDRSGNKHPLVRPLDNETRVEIERQVFEALGLEESIACTAPP